MSFLVKMKGNVATNFECILGTEKKSPYKLSVFSNGSSLLLICTFLDAISFVSEYIRVVHVYGLRTFMGFKK